MDGVRARWMVGVSMVGVVGALLVALLVGSSTQADQGSVAAPSVGVRPAPIVGGDIASLRTERSRTYRRKDGSRVTRIWPVAVNYRDGDGHWQPIDPRLTADGDGVQSEVAPVKVQLPDDLSDPAKVTDTGARWVTFSLDGADPGASAPAVDGATASYADVLDGVDARYEAAPTGVKETLTLQDASAPSSYSYTLNASAGLTPAIAADGSVVFSDAAGHKRFVLPAPTVQEQGQDQPVAEHVAYHLADGGSRLTVDVDPAWLAGASFPVKVDPSVWQYDTLECTLTSGAGASSSDCGDDTLSVGHRGGATPQTQRAVVRFDDLGAIDRTASIVDAQLFVTVDGLTGTGSPALDVFGLNTAPQDGATWDTYDGTDAWSTAGGDIASSPVDTSVDDLTSPGATAIFDVSPLIEQWVHDPSANKGFLLAAHDETAQNTFTIAGQATWTSPIALSIDWAARPGHETGDTYQSIGIDDSSNLSVNPATGNLALTNDDVSLASGLLSRTYNSTEAATSDTTAGPEAEPYGLGWTWTLGDAGLSSTYIWPDDSRTIFGAGGAVYRFDRDPAKDTATDLGYDAPAGLDATLKVAKDDDTAVLTRADGSVWRYAAPGWNSLARLTGVTDADDHTTTLTWNLDDRVETIADDQGTTLTFHYDPSGGQLDHVTDQDDHTYTYAIDTASGNPILTAYTDADQHTTSYTYADPDDTDGIAHRLITVTPPDGHAIDLHYGTDTDTGRVTQITRHTDTNPAHDEIWQFDYHPASTTGDTCPSTVDSHDVIGRTVETAASGNHVTYCYGADGTVLQTIGPPTPSGPPTISGTAREGETLTASTGSWNGGTPFTYTYQWQRCDGTGENCSDVADATGSTYTPGAEDVGSTIQVAVTATNSSSSATATSAHTASVVSPPRIDTSPSIEGAEVVGTILTATDGTWTSGDSPTFARQWRRCDSQGAVCHDIAGATSSTYALTASDLRATVRVAVTATNATGSATAVSEPSDVVVAAATTNTVPPSISGDAHDEHVLTADDGAWSPSPVALVRQWQRCDGSGTHCEDIDGATALTYTLTGDDVGTTIRVVVTADYGNDLTDVTSVPTPVIAASPPAGVQAPSVSGVAVDGRHLAVSDGKWSGSTPLGHTYQWRRCDASGSGCEDIGGATDADYLLTSADVGSTIVAVVTAHNATGSASVVSAASAVITAAGPTNSAPPAVAGTAMVGESLAAGTGEWSGTDLTYAFQWRRCDSGGASCTDISAATARTYVPVAADAGHALRVVVTADDTIGSISARSAASAVVVPAATFTAAISGIATLPAAAETDPAAGVLRAVPGDVTGADPVTFTYQWQRCDAAGASCADVAGAVERSYALLSSDLGATLRVQVTATLGDATIRTAMSPVTAPVVAAYSSPYEQELPAVTGRVAVGSTASATSGAWPLTSTLMYAWLRCDADGLACSPIAGATSAAYTTQAADAGHRLVVQVTGTDSYGSTTLTSRPSDVVSAGGMVNSAPPTLTMVAGSRGSALHAVPGTWSGAGSTPITYTYQWQSCDADGDHCVRLVGVDGDSHSLDEADVDTTLRVSVIAQDDAGRSTSRSAASDVVAAAAPAAGAVPTVTGTPRVDGLLAADAGTWTAVGRVDSGFQWQRCDATGSACVAIDGATDSTYAPGGDDVGQRLRVKVTVVNGEGSASSTSAATATVASSLGAISGPQNTFVPAIAGTPTVGQTLTVTPGLWTGTGDISYTYRWQTCDPDGGCVDVANATDDSLVLGAQEAGAFVKALVTATDEGGSNIAQVELTRSVASTTDITPDAAPVVSGTPDEGATLTASHGAWTAAGTLTYDVQWQRCDDDGAVGCTSIDEATQDSYTPTHDDVDEGLRAVVTASDSAGHRVSVMSAAAGPVTPESPFARSAPQITGYPTSGATLHATAPTWDGAAPIVSTYQWQRCDDDSDECTDIDGATSDDYVAVGADFGVPLQVVVTGTNAHGATSEASAATDPIAAVGAPTATALPQIGGAAAEGQTLTATTGTWSTIGAATYTYQWLACGDGGDGCAPIDGETGNQLILGPDTTFGTVRVAVTAHAAAGSATARSAATATIEPTAPADDAPITNTGRPVITGAAHPGATLTASTGTWDGPDDLTYQYRWRLCPVSGDDCSPIDDATGSTYVPTAAQIGQRIGVYVTAVSGSGSVTVAAPLTHAVVAAAPVVTSSAWLFWGNAVVGAAVTVDPGQWSDPDADLSESWERCSATGTSCTAIADATGLRYDLSSEDLGHTVRAVVTATNDLGSATATTSTTAVVAVGLHVVTAPSLGGDAVVGQTLTLDEGQWSNDASLSAVWQRCDNGGSDCVDLDLDPWTTTYALSKADIDHTIKVMVVATDDGGQVTAETDATTVVAAAAMPHLDVAPTLSGDAVPGGTLTVADGSWSGAPGTADHDWLRCDSDGAHCHPVDGAHDATYRVARSDTGGELRALITVTNAAGSVSARTAATTVVPAPPAISNLTAPATNTPFGLGVGKSVTVSSGTWAGAPAAVTDQWQRCDPGTTPLACDDIAGAADSYHYTSGADVGYLLRVKETATDPTATPVTVYSQPTAGPVTVQMYNYGMSISGARAAGQVLTAHPSVAPAVALPQNVDFRFERADGGATTVVQDGPAASYQLTDADVGHDIAVTVTVTALRQDGGATVGTASATAETDAIAARVTNDAAPTITGTATAGAELDASTGTWHGGGGTLIYDYTWERCTATGGSCTAIAGATDADYVPMADDIDHALRVTVAVHPIAADPADPVLTATSTSVGPVSEGDGPAVTTAPVITGNPTERDALTVDSGTWTGSGPIMYTYQWESCSAVTDACVTLDDETNQRHVATALDVDRTLKVIVTATGPGGRTSVTTAATAPVALGGPPSVQNTPSMTLLGTPDPGSTLVTDGGDWDGAGQGDLSYEWRRCDALGAGCTTISGADGQSYDLTDADVDHQVQVVVTARNDDGSAQAVSDLSEAITANGGGLMRPAFAPARTSAANAIVYFDNEPEPADRDSPEQTLRLVDGDGGQPNTVASCYQLTGYAQCALGHPRISPNLKMIAVENHPAVANFVGAGGGQSGIYLVNYDGSRPRYLANGFDPVWNPDGTDVMYITPEQNGVNTALIARADGQRSGHPRPLVAFGGAFENTPEVADDGSVVFAGAPAGTNSGSDQPIYDLYIKGADDGAAHRVSLPSRFASVAEPRFTADGTAITFLAVMQSDWNTDHGERYSGWKVDLDGSGLTRMTPDDNQVYSAGETGTDRYTTSSASYVCQTYDTQASRCSYYGIVGGQLMTAATDGTDVRSLGIGNAGNPALQPSPAPTVRAVSNPLTTCRFIPRRSPNDHYDEDAVNFQAANEGVGFDLDVAACGPNIVIRQTGTISIVQVKTQTLLQRPLRIEYRHNPVPALNHPIVPLRYRCTPGMDGLQNYLVTLTPPPEFSGKAIRFGEEEVEPILSDGPTQQIVHFRCPTTTQRQQAEFNAWSHLGAYNPKTHRYVRDGRGVPSRVLGQNIGSLKPTNDRGAWDAHHVVPARDSIGVLRRLQAGTFRCHIYPNSATNGTWLRSYAYKSDTTKYDGLDTADKKRQWHPLTYIPSLKAIYYNNLSSDLVGHGIASDGTCASRSQLLSAIGRVTAALVAGTYLPKSLEEGYGS